MNESQLPVARTLAPAGGCWLTACLVTQTPGIATWLAVGLAVLTAIAIGVTVRFLRPRTSAPARQSRRWIGTLALMCALSCAVAGTVSNVLTKSEAARQELEPGTRMVLDVRQVGNVATVQRFGADRQTVNVRTIDPPHLTFQTWFAEGAGQPPGHGLPLRVIGEVQATPNVTEPVFHFEAEQIIVLPPALAREQVAGALAQLREEFLAATDEHKYAELVPGFAIGDTSAVSEQTTEVMRESTLLHLTAVSGANCALVIGACLGLSRQLGIPRRVRILIGLCGLSLFVLLIGPDISVQRAGIMAGVMLLGGLTGRCSQGLYSLGFAVVLLLLMDPWQATAAGFVLSVSATFGILTLAGPLERGIRKLSRHTWRWSEVLSTPFAMATAAGLTCAPYLLVLDEGVSLIGILANVLVAPFAPVATGFGLLAVFVLGPVPWLSHCCIEIASWCTSFITHVARITSGIEAGRLSWVDGTPGSMLLASLIIGALLIGGLRSGKISLFGVVRAPQVSVWGEAAQRPRVLDVVLQGSTAVLVTVLLMVTVVDPAAESLRTPRKWLFVACDVGQGDAVLVRDPDTKATILIDTGEDEEALTKCFRRFHVNELDLVILTHDDRDHVGALSVVLPITREAIIAPPIQSGKDAEPNETREVVRSLEAATVPYRYGFGGDSYNIDNSNDGGDTAGILVDVFAPMPLYQSDSRNDGSLVTRIETQGYSMLALGDTGKKAQRYLLREHISELRGTTVTKAAHHGSPDTSHELLENLGSSALLVSVGADNGYGHPASKVLQSASRSGMVVLRTDRHGSVALYLDRDGQLRAWTEVAREPLFEPAPH